jgi:hypothetical protein
MGLFFVRRVGIETDEAMLANGIYGHGAPWYSWKFGGEPPDGRESIHAFKSRLAYLTLAPILRKRGPLFRALQRRTVAMETPSCWAT